VVDADAIIDDAARDGSAAIPVLTAFFARAKDIDAKQQAASNLVILGDKEPLYWNFLMEQARAAVESNPPFPSMFAKQPSQGQAGMSPEMAAWVKARGLAPEAAMEVALTLNWRLIRMARTGDPRGAPVLERALDSRSIFFKATAVMGFAAARQVSAIPLILNECKRSPTQDDARLIAAGLPFFHDPEADRGYLWYFSAEDLEQQKKHIGTNPWQIPTAHAVERD